MGSMETSTLAANILAPLSPNTAALLKPVGISNQDRIKITIDTRNDDYFFCEIYGERNGVRVPASTAASLLWLRNILDKQEANYGQYRLAATDINCLIINAQWKPSAILFSDEAQAKYIYLISRFMSQTYSSKIRADYKINKVLPPEPVDFIDSPTKPLTDYQKVALFSNAHALFMEQGTGKTPVIIRRICENSRKYKARTGKVYNVLIVCPKNVRNNWLREIKEFTTVTGNISVVRGTKLEREKQILTAFAVRADVTFSVIICSYDSISSTSEMFSVAKFNDIILDESHYIKNSRTKRWKCLKDLRENSDNGFVLSGTPITNSIIDLYTQLEFIDKGMSGFSSFAKFKEFYGVYEQDFSGTGVSKLVGYQNLPFLQERLSRVAMLITKVEAIPTMPLKVYLEREITLSEEQLNWYKSISDSIAIEIKNADMNNTMTANHFLTKMLRLAQITSGFLKTDDEVDTLGIIQKRGKIVRSKENPKLEELVKVIQETTDKEKIIVWANWTEDIIQIAERLKKENINCCTFTGSTSDTNRIKAEDDFNKKDAVSMKVFIGNAAAGGTGLNLRGYDPSNDTHGANCTTVVYYSQGWSMVHRSQSEDRAHRKGTRVPVTYVDLVVPSSIDEEIRNAVKMKQIDARSVQDIKEVMLRVLATMPSIEPAESE